MTPGPIGGFANVAKGPDGLAIASLVLGILSVVTCIGSQSCINLPLGIAGLVCGILSKTPGSMRSWGIGLSIAGLVIFLLMFFVIGAAALAFLGLGAAGAAGAAAGGGAP
jgi:hypothetical protein